MKSLKPNYIEHLRIIRIQWWRKINKLSKASTVAELLSLLLLSARSVSWRSQKLIITVNSHFNFNWINNISILILVAYIGLSHITWNRLWFRWSFDSWLFLSQLFQIFLSFLADISYFQFFFESLFDLTFKFLSELTDLSIDQGSSGHLPWYFVGICGYMCILSMGMERWLFGRLNCFVRGCVEQCQVGSMGYHEDMRR